METHSNSQEESFIWDALNLFHRYFCVFIRFLMVKLYGAHGQSMPSIDDRLLLESATSIAEKIRTKQVTAVQVMIVFIRRIKQINPLLNCVVDERYKDALTEATAVDELIASNQYTVDELRETKPFLGVPITCKESLSVKGLIHSCGLWQRRNERSTKNFEALQLMCDAGAIPLAVTNVPILGMWWETSNKIYGRTCNPYDTNRTPGGSSGGESALLAAAGSPFGIGSDIGGSIRMPAFFTGIFGHKPSALIVSNDGMWPKVTGPARQYALVVGPMCRFACDLKPMLKIMAGDKAKDLRLDEPVNLSSLKYFYQDNGSGEYFVSPIDHDIRVGIEKAVQHIEKKFSVNAQRVEIKQLKYSRALWMPNLLDENDIPFECKLANLNGRTNSFIELLKFCFGNSKLTMAAILFGIQTKFNTEFGSPRHKLMVKKRDELLHQFEEMLGDNGVFIYPTHPTVAPYHNEPIFRFPNFSSTAIFNSLGFPSTAVPLGIGPSERLPIGLQVVASRNQDRLCLAVASELERAFGGWVAPEINVR